MIYNYAKPKTTPSTPKSSFATAPGNAMAGKTISAPGNAMNARVVAANKASGGTTTSTYRDKYTAAEGGPGASALGAAAMTQAAGFAKIFDKVANVAAATNIAQGKAAPIKSTYIMEHPDPTKAIKIQNGTATLITKDLPAKKIIVEPLHPDQGKDSGAFIATTEHDIPIRTVDTNSTDNTVAPMKAGIAGAAANNYWIDLASQYGINYTPGMTQNDILKQVNLPQGLPSAKPKTQQITPIKTPTQASGIRGSIASMVSGMAQMLAPGVQARISAKRGS
jgi:hypothetical protein